MTQQFQPRPYQDLMIQHALTTPRCAIWAGMGMGKTSAALVVVDVLSLVEHGPALVLAPLRVAMVTWPNEARKWDRFQHLRVSPICGTVAQRRAALRRDAEIYTINYENIPWLVEELGDAWHFAVIISDESTRLKGHRRRQGRHRTKALALVAFRSPRFIELTGTPSPNGLQDLWGQIWFLDRGAALGLTFTAFIDRWFRRVQVGHTPQAVRYEPFEHSRAEIEDRLRPLCLTLDPADYFDLEKPIIRDIEVDLPPKARAAYKAMEREAYLEISQDVGVEALNAASKSVKCLQIANGAIYTDETGGWAPIHDAKLKALESIKEEASGMPLLVVYQFKSDLERLRKAFPKGRVLDTRPKTVADWNAGKIPLLFVHPASAGHGLSLEDGGNIIVFFGLWWDLEQYLQVIERIGPVRQLQSGYRRPVWIYRIIATDTVDEQVIDRHETKRATQDLLLEAMKRRLSDG